MRVSRARKPPPAEIGWAYFLDVDGTLLDIAETPGGIHVDATLLDLIGRLHRASDGAVALVSGRALSDLEERLGVLRLPMAGQHGLERRDVGGRLWIHAPPPETKAKIRAALAPVLDRYPALLLEDKGLALALHYRRAPGLAAYAHRLMAQLAAGAGGAFELQKGKRVVELKPAGVDKGSAIADYMTEPPFQGRRPVFIGDDVNDEHGFAEINRIGGISIKVGPGRSCGRYRLANVAAVRHWLAEALTERT
jgi:trehalose 6-phosphate phosphatase